MILRFDKSFLNKRRSFILLFFAVFFSFVIKAQIRTQSPKSSSLLFTPKVVFKWDSCLRSNQMFNYELKVAADSSFSIASLQQASTDLTDTITLNTLGKYYWKVIAKIGGELIDSSKVQDFTLANLSSLPNLKLLFLTDSLVLTNGNQVEQWTNLADPSLHAVELIDSLKPILVNNGNSLNQAQTLLFDGLDDRLTISSAVGMSEIYTISNYTLGATFTPFRTLISGRVTGTMYRAQGGGTNFGPSQVFGNNIFINGIQTKDFAPLDSFKFVSGQVAGTYPLSTGILIGSNVNLNNRFWGGNIGDIVAFDAPVNDSIRNIVRQHFCQKYNNPLELGENLISAGKLCDSVISAPLGYERYQWSNGDTTTTTSIALGEELSLEVTTKMGCTFSDEIAFDFPLFTPTDQTLCSGDSLIWDAELNKNTYNFQWSDGTTDSLLVIAKSGEYSLRIIDQNLCEFNSDTISVNIDTTLRSLDLVPDSSICREEVIVASIQGFSLDSIRWSSGSDSISEQIDTAGIYIIRASLNGCSLVDTAAISIKGAKPNVDFRSQNFYLSPDDSVSFTDLSSVQSPDIINQWDWNFGDGSTSALQNPFNQYSSLGVFSVKLRAGTDKNCFDSTAKEIEILPLPPTTFDDYSIPRIGLQKPKNDALVMQAKVIFSWNEAGFKQSSDLYRLEVANDSAFQNILLSSTVAKATDTLILPNEGVFFWKISLINSNQLIASSKSYSFVYSEITNLPNLTIFLNTDSVRLNQQSNVTKWINLVDSAKSAVQLLDSIMPNWIIKEPMLDSANLISFDGIDDRLAIDSSLGIAEMYTIANYTAANNFQGTVGLFSGQNSGVIYRSRPGTTRFGPSQVFPNAIRVNNALTDDFAPLNEYKLLSGRIAGTFPLNSGMLIGSDANIGGRFWQGSIGDILSFDAPINDSIRDIVQLYFCQKFGRPLDLGPDLFLDYGFCETEFSADTIYSDYQWSNGDTTPQTKLLPGLSYTLTVTNQFGCQYVDDIQVNFGIRPFQDITICPGDSVEWNNELDSENYFIQWSTGSSDSLISISNQGNYFYTVLDSNDCGYVSDTVRITVDSSLVDYTLGRDTAICRGGIYESPISDTIKQYSWSNNSLGSKITIDSAGLYIIEVDNGLCKAKDSIQITIAGELPTPNFSASDLCIGDSVSFVDSSIAPSGDSIINWRWLFGDGNSDTLSNPKHFYLGANSYNVSLLVETDKLCEDTITKQITINPKPTAWFGSDASCAKQSATFIDSSQVSSGSINAYYWNFGDPNSLADTSRIQGPSYTYDTLGFYLVTQIVQTDQNCRDTVQRFQEVNASPNVDFSSSGFCLNDSTIFTNQTTLAAGSISAYKWFFNAGNQNFQETTVQNPSIQFVDTGLTIVTLRATSDEGCISVHRDSLNMRNNPRSNFNLSTYCEDTLFTIIDQTVSQDSIISYQWILEPNDTSLVPNPSFKREQAGFYALKQKVLSSFGCVDSLNQMLEVKARPTADFTILNNGSGAPYQLRVANASNDASSYLWNLGNGNTTTEFEPNTIYPDTGEFPLELIAISQFGCKDTMAKTLNVSPFLLEALLEDIFLRELFDGRLEVTARIVNSGNNTINQLRLVASMNDEFQFAESLNETIFKGERKAYQFNSTFLQGDNKKVDFICVKIDQLNQLPYTGSDELCEKAFNNELKFEVFPNPANQRLNLRYILPTEGRVELAIFDQLGRRLLDQEVGTQEEGLYLFNLDVDYLNQGIYFLRFSYNGSSFTETFIIER